MDRLQRNPMFDHAECLLKLQQITPRDIQIRPPLLRFTGSILEDYSHWSRVSQIRTAGSGLYLQPGGMKSKSGAVR
jgi:hypothetical protein